MNYKIVIPSINRAKILKERTIKLLKDYDIPMGNVYVFVTRADAKDYMDTLDEPGITYQISPIGIANSRNTIGTYFSEGQFVLTLDDDIKEIQELDGEKLVKLNCLKTLIEKVYGLLKEGGCCGVYPTNNAYFMKPYTSDNLKFCIGAMRWFINDRSIETTRTYNLLEDYETSMKYYQKYGFIYRLNYIAINHDCNGGLGGGLSSVSDRRYEKKKIEVEKFYKENYKHCSINDRITKKGKKIDIKFKKCRRFSK